MTQTHTQNNSNEVDEGLFIFVCLIVPIFLYMVFVPMPFGWSEGNLSMDSFSHMDTYIFIASTCFMIYLVKSFCEEYKQTFGKSFFGGISSTDACSKSTNANSVKNTKSDVSTARIVRNGNQMTIFDENNRVVYKKL